MKEQEERKEESNDGKGEQAVREPEQNERANEASKQMIPLQEKLAEAEAKAAEYLDGWQRAQAEFSNYKKRQMRDQELLANEARSRVLKRYLEIMDDLELILKNKPQEGPGAEWAKSMDLLFRKLQSFLEAEGISRLDPLGEPFDANMHEAVVEEKSEAHKTGTVIEVLRPGYLLGERVIRPASVKVAK